MTLLVFGTTGQVARALATRGRTTHLGRDRVDLTDPHACARAIEDATPAAVINAAAWTAVDAAEENEAEALLVNGAAPGAMAETCARLGIPLVHISTDYVFDGIGGTARMPDAAPAPLNAYGRTKLSGEEAVRAAGGPHAILRTSWVFSGAGRNFVTTMLRLGRERAALSIVADQVGGPTPADAIAGACLGIADQLRDAPEKSGTYHFAGSPDTSWAGFARAIFAAADLDCAVTDIATAAYPTPAARPLNSRLDCAATETVFGLGRPDWRAHLDHILRERQT